MDGCGCVNCRSLRVVGDVFPDQTEYFFSLLNLPFVQFFLLNINRGQKSRYRTTTVHCCVAASWRGDAVLCYRVDSAHGCVYSEPMETQQYRTESSQWKRDRSLRPHQTSTQLLGLFVLYKIQLCNAKQIKYPCRSVKPPQVWLSDWVESPGRGFSWLFVRSGSMYDGGGCECERSGVALR